MKIIYNNIIPFKGKKLLNFFGLLFVRNDSLPVTEIDLNHEAIHTIQMKELLYILFYIIYILEWIYRLFEFRFNTKEAYKNISFEKEAYSNESNLEYLNNRKKFSQWRNFS